MADPLMGGGGANCLIISANQVVTPYPVYPLGAACIVASLSREGHSARHFDLLADGGMRELQALVSGSRFDLVGVSIRNIDSVDSADPAEYLGHIRKVVECVRDFSDAPIVLGGPGFSIMPETLMHLFEAEYGIVGEGEEQIAKLASALVSGGTLPENGLLRQEEPLDRFGTMELSRSTAKYYTAGGGMLNLQSKRGCPYRCSYCSYPAIEGRTVRYRDPEAVVDDFERLVQDCGGRYIFFADSVFNDPAKKYLEIAELLARRGNRVPWCAFFRPADLEIEELQLLKKAGLTAMELGTDGATDATLSGLNKTYDFSEVERVHNLIVDQDIPCAHFVIFGGPGETRRTLADGLKNLERLDKSVVFAFLGIRILPGTGIYETSIAEGIINRKDPLIRPTFYYSPHLPAEELEQEVVRAFAPHQEWVYPAHEFNDRVAMLHKMGHAGPLWDLLLKRRSR